MGLFTSADIDHVVYSSSAHTRYGTKLENNSWGKGLVRLAMNINIIKRSIWWMSKDKNIDPNHIKYTK